MGICSARNIPYLALRTSIVGALIPTEADFAEFFKSCRIETHGLKTTLTIHQLQSFFVVVSGEIAVCLTPKEGKTVHVGTFRAGETIYFFHSNSISCSGGGIMNTSCHLRLNLQFRSSPEAGTAQVIGMDRGSVDRYLDERPHLKDLKRLLDLQLSDLKDFPAFASIAPHQVRCCVDCMLIHTIDNLFYSHPNQ